VTAPTVVILAAGHGTRMRSAVPKMLHPLCGRPLFAWPVAAAREAGARRIVVVGGPDRALEPHLPDGVELAVQAEARGTGDAVHAAAGHIDPGDVVLVVNGDAPLITAEALLALLESHVTSGAAGTLGVIELEDPGSFGRVIRAGDGSVERVVETKAPGDASAEELAIREVNAGVYAFDGAALLDALPRIGSDNAQGERYLPDVVHLLRAAGAAVGAHRLADPALALGVNDRAELAAVRAIAQARLNDAHMRAGVTLVDPRATLIDAGVRIGADTVVEPGSSLRGETTIGSGARIGPHTTLIDAVVGDEVSVVHSYLQGCEVRAGATVGPFAYLRPGTVMRERSKAGTFVEIKNSDVGERSKVPHLTYLGDADVGEDSNLGAGTITTNYDGERKHRTTIGDRVHSSVDVAFVAPVEVADDAWTAAGSVITRDIPPGALGVARERQSNVEGYDERRRDRAREAAEKAPPEDAGTPDAAAETADGGTSAVGRPA
jgi:bifunctional UDP-N-acetylglucosamine pyrophosphorylase/glucosamine-1-phosphate N-acetyltransferase